MIFNQMVMIIAIAKLCLAIYQVLQNPRTGQVRSGSLFLLLVISMKLKAIALSLGFLCSIFLVSGCGIQANGSVFTKEVVVEEPEPIRVITKPKVSKKFVEGGVAVDEFERFERFKVEEEEGEDYSEMFASQESARNAFVASEIFAKKF